jgi:hypothetical protein
VRATNQLPSDTREPVPMKAMALGFWQRNVKELPQQDKAII